MPIAHEMACDSKILRITYSGDLTLQEQLSFFDSLVERAVLQSPIRILLDRRAMTSVAPSADARVAAEHLESWRDLLRGGRVGFVVSKRVEFGLVRMFAAFSSALLMDTAVFYSVEEARAWLLDSTEASPAD